MAHEDTTVPATLLVSASANLSGLRVLGFADGGEAGSSARATVAAEGKAGWFQEEAAVNCSKRLWSWEDDTPINVICICTRPTGSDMGAGGFIAIHPDDHLKRT